MRNILRILQLSILCTLLLYPAAMQAQQPEQDCINAIPVCQNIYTQTNSYVGEGLNPNEINPAISCLGSGEENDVWYIFTVQTAGVVGFTITPLNITNDYDWAVYNLTNASCADIATDPTLEVSCNYSGTPGNTGPNTPGAPNSQTAIGTPFNGLIPVNVGETYVVNVSNFSGTAAGYTINFSASTAVIFDNIPPEMDTVFADCGGDISVVFSENIVCSTVQPTDFTLTGPGGPYTVTAAAGSNCTGGGTFENEFELTVTPPITSSGTYYVSLVDIVEDNCGNIGVFSTDSLQLVLPNIAASASPDTVCLGDMVTVSTPAQPGFTYTWSTGLTGATATFTPIVSSTYDCFATGPNGCTYLGSVYIHVWDNPTSTFTATPTQACPDQPLAFDYTGTSAPGATFNWDFSGGNILSGSGAGPYTVDWPNAGTFNVNLMVESQRMSESGFPLSL